MHDLAAAVQRLKPPGSTAVEVIAGPTEPVDVVLATSGGSSFPLLQPSCSGAQTAANPAVRLQAFAREWDPVYVVESSCAQSYGPLLERIARRLPNHQR